MIEKVIQDILDLGARYQKKKQAEEEQKRLIQEQLKSYAEMAKSKLGIIDTLLPNANTKILNQTSSDCIAIVTIINKSCEHGCAIPYQLGIAISYSNGLFNWYIHGEKIQYFLHSGYNYLTAETIMREKKKFDPKNIEAEICRYLNEYYTLCKSLL